MWFTCDYPHWQLNFLQLAAFWLTSLTTPFRWQRDSNRQLLVQHVAHHSAASWFSYCQYVAENCAIIIDERRILCATSQGLFIVSMPHTWGTIFFLRISVYEQNCMYVASMLAVRVPLWMPRVTSLTKNFANAHSISHWQLKWLTVPLSGWQMERWN